MKREMEKTVTVKGSAETKEKALAVAMSHIKKEVEKETQGMLFRIEPLDMDVIHAKEVSYKERFLGILFPRIRTHYELTLQVKVRLNLIELDKISFHKETKEEFGVAQFIGKTKLFSK
ncbi:DUF4312 family protein [Pullulanibacillus sp. KACC 23026]|uniref:DUF4312 family protein n=1 Tax=Pullulanibacillus sp. KACC 23026 TaxID=3028315 RepID=UPI0023B0B2DC|nr:DUF4312 family protein [Pullulanibacillus sp. KACC 23026]WEG11215.1 DUF4312 family protein [Pullulanibacillus sp. KACC 23026]